jgi:hypothetical protein
MVGKVQEMKLVGRKGRNIRIKNKQIQIDRTLN